MDKLVPGAEFCKLIEPFYPKPGVGRQTVGRERMLRMYFIANWFNLADAAYEDVRYVVAAFRGMKVLPGVDCRTGLTHSATVTQLVYTTAMNSPI